MKKEFEFVIEWPKEKDPFPNGEACQFFRISATYPTYVYSNLLKPEDEWSNWEQQQMAINELKVRLIQDIANAKFVVREKT